MKKAFVACPSRPCYDRDDEAVTMIYFKERDIHARRDYADEFNDGELGGICIRRDRNLDRFGCVKNIPFWYLVHLGWSTACDECGESVDEDNLNNRGLDPTGVVGTFFSRVFCSEGCHVLWKADDAERKHIEGQAIYNLEQHLYKLYGESITIGKTHAFSSCYALKGRVIEQAYVNFTFPGQTIGECRINEKNVVKVPAGAMTSYNEWRETHVN